MGWIGWVWLVGRFGWVGWSGSDLWGATEDEGGVLGRLKLKDRERLRSFDKDDGSSSFDVRSLPPASKRGSRSERAAHGSSKKF